MNTPLQKEFLLDVGYKKKPVTYSMSEDIKKDFVALAKDRGLNMSAVIEKMVLGLLISEGIRKKQKKKRDKLKANPLSELRCYNPIRGCLYCNILFIKNQFINR